MSEITIPNLGQIVEIETKRKGILGKIIEEKHIGILMQQVDKGEDNILRVTLSRSFPADDSFSYVLDKPYLEIKRKELKIDSWAHPMLGWTSFTHEQVELDSIMPFGERVIVQSPFFQGKEDEFEYHAGYYAGVPAILPGNMMLARTNVITSQRLRHNQRYNVSVEAEIHKLVEPQRIND